MAEIIGKRVISLDEIDSTNNYAIALCNDDACPEGTIVVAKSQVDGRGQRGNRWESVQGLNLLCSVVLYPDFLPVSYQFLISKVVALAIYDVVAGYTPEPCTVKWPNDIYVGDKKIAGILIENSIMGNTLGYSVAGIGININQIKFSDKIPNPVSLRALNGIEIQPEEVLNKLKGKLNYWYSGLRSADMQSIDDAYRERMYKLNTLYCFRDEQGFFEGIIRGVDEIGRLLISDTENKIRVYHFKEVEFVGPV